MISPAISVSLRYSIGSPSYELRAVVFAQNAWAPQPHGVRDHHAAVDERAAEDRVPLGIHLLGVQKDFGQGVHPLAAFLLLRVVKHQIQRHARLPTQLLSVSIAVSASICGCVPVGLCEKEPHRLPRAMVAAGRLPASAGCGGPASPPTPPPPAKSGQNGTSRSISGHDERTSCQTAEIFRSWALGLSSMASSWLTPGRRPFGHTTM